MSTTTTVTRISLPDPPEYYSRTHQAFVQRTIEQALLKAVSTTNTPGSTGSILPATSNVNDLLSSTGSGWVARAAPEFNVKAYGAKGDGVTDDTAAIQAAMTAACAVGGLTVIPSGTYNVASNLVPSGAADTAIEGRGWPVLTTTAGNSILKQTAHGYLLSVGGTRFTGDGVGIEFACTPSGTQYFEYDIHDCKFEEGTFGVPGSGVYGVKLVGAREGMIRECHFQYCGGIYFRATVGPEVINCQWKYTTYGVNYDGDGSGYSAGLKMTGGAMLGVTYSALRMSLGDYFQVNGTLMDFCGDNAPPIDLIGQNHGYIAGCYLTSRCTYPTVVIEKDAGTGIVCQHIELTGNTIYGTVATNPDFDCINVTDSVEVNIHDNEIAYYLRDGVRVGGASYGVWVERNHISPRPTYGTNAVNIVVDSATNRVRKNVVVAGQGIIAPSSLAAVGGVSMADLRNYVCPDTTQYANFYDYAPSVNATTAVYGYRTRITLPAGLTTAVNYSHYIDNLGLGAGASATLNVGLEIAAQTAASTNYAIRTHAGLVSFGDEVLATTRLTTGLLGTRTAANVVLDWNGVPQLTLASLAASLAGDLSISGTLQFGAPNTYDIGGTAAIVHWTTVGDTPAWSYFGTVSRTAAAITVGGLPLDLFGDNDAAQYAMAYRTIAFTGNGTKTVSALVQQYQSYAYHTILLTDQTAPATRGGVVINFTSATPTVAGYLGTEQVLSVAPYGTAWRVVFRVPGIVAANANRLEVRPALHGGYQSDIAALYIGDVWAWNATLPVASPRTGYFGTSVVVGTDPGGTACLRLGGDATINSLGTLDSTAAPAADQFLWYNAAVAKWQPRTFQPQFVTGAVGSSALTDGTYASYAYVAPTWSGTPSAPATPTLLPIYKGMIVDMGAAPPAGSAYIVDYAVNNSTTFTSGAIASTGQKVVHSNLDLTATYAYKVKLQYATATYTAYSAATGFTAPSSATNVDAFGLVLASQISAPYLSAINADLGTIIAGRVQDNAATAKYGILFAGAWSGATPSVAYLDFTATGSGHFLHHAGLDLNADGTAAFSWLDVTGDLLSGSNYYGIHSRPTLAGVGAGIFSDATYGLDTTSAFYAAIDAAMVFHGFGTTTAVYGYHFADPSLGAGPQVITTLYGLKIENLTAGATNYPIYTGTGECSLGGQLTLRANYLKVYGDMTGGGTVSGLGVNCPASGLAAPYTWVRMIAQDGSTVWLPAFK